MALSDYEFISRMSQLLVDCVPAPVYEFLSEEKTRTHHNRFIIVNLACGASIQVAESRATLCIGYGLQVGLSFVMYTDELIVIVPML